MAEGPAAGVELLLEARAVDAGLHAREPRGLVDLEQPVHAAEVDRDDRARLLAAAPRGCRRCSCRRRTGSRPRRPRAPRCRISTTAVSSPGRTTTSGTRPRSPRRWRTRSRRLLPRAWTTRSSGVVGDVLVAHRALERGAQLVAQLRLGDVELGEGERARRGLRDVDPEVLLEERPEARLVVVGERDTLVTPPPPLHRAVLSRPCRHCGHGPTLRDGTERRRPPVGGLRAPGVGLEPTTFG